MKNDLFINHTITIPDHELEITASRSGGPGGQHVNKSNTRISVRWNIKNSAALDYEQKERILQKLQSEVTSDGEVIIHSSASRSQEQNKRSALAHLADKIRQALYVPKKRMKTRVPKAIKTARLESKTRHGTIKKMRNKQNWD